MAAKGGKPGDSGNTKIRFIMLEAEGDAADLQQIAQAITNAVRPSVIQLPPTTPVMPLPKPIQHNVIETNRESAYALPVDDTEMSDEQPILKRNANHGTKKRYPPRSPVILNDLDLTSGEIPFTKYFQAKNPSSHIKKYLVIAGWLKEHRQIAEISIDHIYTCYRMLSINVVDDVGSVFRSGKQQGWFGPGTERGFFAINHIGLNQVNDLPDGE